jgi:hypothetical protein
MKNIIILIGSLFILSSCEQVISLSELNLDKNLPKVVIEGNITNQAGPYFVKISRSSVLSGTTANPTVDNAQVTITDNAGNTETLTAIGNGTYQTNKLEGKIGRTYTLTVKADGQTYTAQSTMPEQVEIEEIRANTEIFGGDTTLNIVPVYRDPASFGNNYRFLLKINGNFIKQHFLMNDNVTNGKANTEHLNDLEYKLYPGDVLDLTLQHVDKNVGLYYAALYQTIDSGPGGGTTPNNPPNNISGGALGLFSAHAVHSKTYVVE